MDFIQYRTDVETALRGVPRMRVGEAEYILKSARNAKKAVYIMGNGGSAATASHFANDLVKMCGIRAYAIPDMLPLITAYGNDESWTRMYSAVLEKLIQPHDVVVAISCSGNSLNVVSAIQSAIDFGHPAALIKTIALIGADLECTLAKLNPDVLISVPFRDIRVQEDCHMVICHAIAGALKLGYEPEAM